MKSLTIAAFVAAQLLAVAQPALAADFGDGTAASDAQRRGAFAGARLRVPLGGERTGKASAGLTVAPVTQGRQADGSIRTRFGEGVEYGFAGGKAAELRLAGRPISQVAQGRTAPDGRKLGVSTIGWIAIGTGVAIVATYAILVASYDPCCE